MDEKLKDAGPRRAPFARPLLATALAASALAPSAVQAQVDIFLRLDGIPGESQDAKHKNEIDVISWSDAIAAGGAERSATTRTVCSGISVTKQVDKASVKLLETLFTNGTINGGTLSLRNAGDKSQEFYIIELSSIKVASVAQNLASDSLQEAVVLKPAAYKFRYYPQKADGTLDTPVTGSGNC